MVNYQDLNTVIYQDPNVLPAYQNPTYGAAYDPNTGAYTQGMCQMISCIF